LAEYEIQHDAYRGLFNLDVPSPWLKCHYSDQDLGKVSKVCRTACPSLLRWTAELDALVSRRNKRKRSEGDEAIPVSLGRRGRHSDFRCPCDHNPVSFCRACPFSWYMITHPLSIALYLVLLGITRRCNG
jgi:hypothetical protein